MPKYKATAKFKKELGIENNYQYLTSHIYYELLAGAEVELKLNEHNQYLIEDDYLEAVRITSIKAESAPGKKLKETN